MLREALVTPVRAEMGEEAWSAAFAAGQLLSLEEAAAEVLQEPRAEANP
jgi:hypothetical protein